jgi:hypothetical protein
MKRKLRIDELSVASFTTQEESKERGTVRGLADTTQQVTMVYGSCVALYTCEPSCQARTCAATCGLTCPFTCDDKSCNPTCIAALC